MTHITVPVDENNLAFRFGLRNISNLLTTAQSSLPAMTIACVDDRTDPRATIDESREELRNVKGRRSEDSRRIDGRRPTAGDTTKSLQCVGRRTTTRCDGIALRDVCLSLQCNAMQQDATLMHVDLNALFGPALEELDLKAEAAKAAKPFVWFPFGGTCEVVYCQLLNDGATITANFYMQQLRALEAKVDESGGFLGKIYFQHGNARPHIARDVKLELCKFGWTILPHPPFSPISRRQTTGFLRI
ncbi:hypothetical protein OESDEN_05089 [Oesophagostomum dentatum]|uniref:Transposase n=1 Tax=Oesophagostomum dentatum TaxID=61180 RepID=A0A0B1THT5_OESDE|nr:hypothetical protein OESDEN_05089 [Oesophagostomum dentatum]